MYKIAIVENEIELAELLKAILLNFCKEYVSTIEVANTYETGLSMLQNGDFNLLLLDIELDNRKTGFELLQELEEPNFHLVIVTSHSEYALQAIKASAIDFLLKPVAPEDIQGMFQRIGEQSNLDNQFMMEQINVLKRNMKSSEPKKIVLRTSEFIQAVTISDIVHCEASSNYTTFNLSSGERIIVSKSLKEFESLLLENSFFRTHRSHMINMNHFLRFDKRDGGSIIMTDKSTIPLSIRKRESFLEHLNNI